MIGKVVKVRGKRGRGRGKRRGKGREEGKFCSNQRPRYSSEYRE